jgi:hypothetical protein
MHLFADLTFESWWAHKLREVTLYFFVRYNYFREPENLEEVENEEESQL